MLGIEVAAILKRRTGLTTQPPQLRVDSSNANLFDTIAATSMPEYVSGWCGHGFKSHLQPLFADKTRGPGLI